MIEREKAGDIGAGWTGAAVEYLVLPEWPLAGDPTEGLAMQLEKGLDQVGAEGWRLVTRMGGGNQLLVFLREVPIGARTEEEAGGEETAGGQSGQAAVAKAG